MCRPSHLKPAVYKVLPGLVITLMVSFGLCADFGLDLEGGSEAGEQRKRLCLLSGPH